MPRTRLTAPKGVGSRTPLNAPTRRSQAPTRPPAPGAAPARAYTAPRMVMIGHSQRLAQPLTSVQKRVVALVAAAILAGATWAVVSPSSTPASRSGCVSVVVASSTGGGLLQNCGAAARAWCRSELGRSDALAQLVLAQCRRAGLQPRRT
jgi:hypothetical protein